MGRRLTDAEADVLFKQVLFHQSQRVCRMHNDWSYLVPIPMQQACTLPARAHTLCLSVSVSIRTIPPLPPLLSLSLSQYDTDGSGEIDLEEFSQMVRQTLELGCTHNLVQGTAESADTAVVLPNAQPSEQEGEEVEDGQRKREQVPMCMSRCICVYA